MGGIKQIKRDIDGKKLREFFKENGLREEKWSIEHGRDHDFIGRACRQGKIDIAAYTYVCKELGISEDFLNPAEEEIVEVEESVPAESNETIELLKQINGNLIELIEIMKSAWN